MELTFIGIAQILIGVYIVLLGSVRSSVIFLLVSAVFAGSASLILTDLGGSSIPPIQFALLFTTLRILAPKGGYLGLLPAAIADNKWIIFFAIYGIVAAYIGPRLFAASVDVFPMRAPATMGPFDTLPLAPTPQNFTAAFYLIGTMLLAITSYIFSRIQSVAGALITALLLASWLHITTGIMDLAFRGTAVDALLTVFRNANYSALDLSVSGFIRIRGVLPEASSYASIGFAFFVANAELWYRSIKPRATGIAASALALLLVLSTASTAYVALALYALFFALRALAFPSVLPPGAFLRASVLTFGILFLVCVLMVVVPRLPFAVYEMVLDMTVGKPSSYSAQQRLFWALQGIDAFAASFGLGIGPGSFRSSSMLTAILGSMGIVGILSFAFYLKTVFAAAKLSSWGIGPSQRQSIGGALGTAAVIGLVPDMISSPHAAPTALFSIMAGAAIGLRSQAGEQLVESPGNSHAMFAARSTPAPQTLERAPSK